MQRNTTQYNTTQQYTIRYNTTIYNTMRYNTIYDTIQQYLPQSPGRVSICELEERMLDGQKLQGPATAADVAVLLEDRGLEEWLVVAKSSWWWLKVVGGS